MELTLIASDIYKVAAVSNNGSCPALDFIKSLEATYTSNGDALLALLDKVSRDGLADLSTVLCHEVDKNEKIFEFIKGRLRLFFFKGKGEMIVICTDVGIKKSNKVDRSQVDKAIKCKQNYLNAVKENKLVVKEST